MEIQQLRTFLAVAEEGHLTRAARRLYISQPAVSGQIKALEEELGIRLFERTPKGMRLTAEGQRLLLKARDILVRFEALADEARELREALDGDLRLGLNTDPGYLRAGAVRALITARHPQLAMHCSCVNSCDIAEILDQGRIEGGFLYCDGEEPWDPRLAGLELCRFRLEVVGPRSWAERLAHTSLDELLGMPWVWTATSCPFHNAIIRRFFAGRPLPEVRTVCDQEDALLAMCASGGGLTMLREQQAQEAAERGEVCIWPWQGPPLWLWSRFVWLRRRDAEPRIRAMVQAVADAWGIPQGEAALPEAS